jgi:acetyl esterase/lipase
MALDRDAERVLEMVRLSGRPPYETLSAPEARELFLATREVLAPDPPPVAEIRELSAPGPAGAAVPVRLYRGATTAAGDILPALVYFHGGGWVIGDLDTMTVSVAISPMRRGVSSSRSITASLRNTNFRQRSRIVSPRPHGLRKRPQL